MMFQSACLLRLRRLAKRYWVPKDTPATAPVAGFAHATRYLLALFTAEVPVFVPELSRPSILRLPDCTLATLDCLTAKTASAWRAEGNYVLAQFSFSRPRGLFVLW